MRKTIEVSKLVDYVNAQLLNEDYGNKESRQALMSMLEHVLLETGNYAGFRYLTNNELRADTTPGVRYNGPEILDYPERFVNTDNTRVQYSAKCDAYARWVKSAA